MTQRAEWFARPRDDAQSPPSPSSPPGLRFACTMCGNCCSGPPGYVLVTDDEADALAGRFSVSRAEFLRTYTRSTSAGRSLTEKKTAFGLDCVFLDRDSVPGKAVCGVYEHRPLQCRTWPFWPSLLRSRAAWDSAAKTCPGMNRGNLVTVEEIRIRRDSMEI